MIASSVPIPILKSYYIHRVMYSNIHMDVTFLFGSRIERMIEGAPK
jgi:hypothetical protein